MHAGGLVVAQVTMDFINQISQDNRLEAILSTKL